MLRAQLVGFSHDSCPVTTSARPVQSVNYSQHMKELAENMGTTMVWWEHRAPVHCLTLTFFLPEVFPFPKFHVDFGP